MVTREYDDRVVQCAELVECPHDAAEALVHAEQHLEPGAHVCIRRAGRRAERWKALDRPKQGGLSNGRLACVRPARHRRAGIASLMAFRWHESFLLSGYRLRAAVIALHEVRVQRLVREKKHERLVRGTLDEIDRVIGQHVRHVAGHFAAFAVHIELRVERFALALHRDPARPPRPPGVVVSHVPLADERSFVAAGCERNRERRQLVTRGISRRVVDDSVVVRVPAGQDGGAARAAERSRRECIQEAGAFPCQAINVRSLDERVTGDANVVPAQVVNETTTMFGAVQGNAGIAQGAGPHRSRGSGAIEIYSTTARYEQRLCDARDEAESFMAR